MDGSAERKVVRSKQLRDLLAASARSVQTFRKLPSFPKPLAMPGQPRWYEDEIVAWRDRRDRAEVVVGSVLANHPELVGMLTADVHAHCVAELERLAREAPTMGMPKAAALWAALAEDLLAVGASIVPAARRLVRHSALAEGGA